AAEQLTLKTKEDLKSAKPLIQKIRSLDQKIAEQAKDVSERSEICTKEAAKIETDKLARGKEQEKRDKAEKTLETVEQYLNDHAQDEWLISGLAGIEEQFGNLLAGQKEIFQKEANLKTADTILMQKATKLGDSTKQCGIRKQDLKEATKTLQQGKDILSKLLGKKLLREYRTEKEALLLEMAYLRKIEELEDHRSKLKDGKPCPLCGSTEHPFAEGNIPEPDEIEQKIESLTKLITKAESQEVAIKKLEDVEATAHKNLNDSEKLEVTAANDKKAAEKAINDLKDGLANLWASFEKRKQAVSDKLQPLGITEIPETQVSSLLESLKSRQKAWQEQVNQKSKIEKKIDAIDSEMKRLNAVIETQDTALTDKQKRLKQLEKEYVTRSDKRNNLYGDRKPDEEENRLSKAIVDAEEIEKKTRDLNTDLQQKLTTAKTHIKSLKERIEQRIPGLKNAETDFSAVLGREGFVDEKEFLEARLTKEKRESLSSRAKKLDDVQTDLKARQKDREKRLSTEADKKITDKPLDELEPQFKKYEDTLKVLRDAIASIKHKLSENTVAKERVKEKQAAIEAQKNECHRWEKLHGLIGSADGKKYRNFAQGLTFELMVSHANRQLEKMTDRYLLIRDNEQPLELNVVDNYQAGEIRSTKNLSGGESFIVSLTLALGLSKMASRKVRVDSLFLDEGFGTLDEEVLETALETLSGLHQEGKLIGIISHLSALKERINTQITIKSVSGGRSSITGPGCSKL
ncbi:hypothetical protein N9Y92_04640, partial [Chlamydiales bacterium]|nr:hypothetical protein [Chlamydiales bacterium]